MGHGATYARTLGGPKRRQRILEVMRKEPDRPWSVLDLYHSRALWKEMRQDQVFTAITDLAQQGLVAFVRRGCSGRPSTWSITPKGRTEDAC